PARRALPRSERRSAVRARANRPREAGGSRPGARRAGAGGVSVRFVTREIGSLGKPPWRVKSFAGRPLEESDLEEARRWGRELQVDGHEELVEKLEQGSADLTEIDDWAARYAIALLERTGLDVVYDGEQRRTEMYDHVAAHARGFEPRGTVRSFDNKYYAKAAVVAEPSVDAPQDVDELRFVQEHTD